MMNDNNNLISIDFQKSVEIINKAFSTIIEVIERANKQAIEFESLLIEMSKQ